MKVKDFIFRFPTNGLTKYDGICRVRLFAGPDNKDFVVLTDLGNKNTGPSVTNSIEIIRLHLIEKGHITNATSIIEHYNKSYPEGGSFDFVIIDEENNPYWTTSNLEKVCLCIQCEPSEFFIPTLKIPHLYDEIEKIRQDINPNIDEPLSEPYNVINRRNNIEKQMLPEGTLSQAIENNFSETEIQKIIKSDLSIIGDFYSHPPEEYICFSEFPVGDGFVDFVLFSGRSRMEVTLIEIKGANYNLINANSYENFSAKTTDAIKQINSRIGYIHRNYKDFKKFVHEIRISIESGNPKFNSFVGSKGNLGVDPNKDIILSTVVIGGRSKDDLKESKLRHNHEMRQSPPIRIESWDSWIKKSRRK